MTLLEKLEAIIATLEPIAEQDWHGKWRIQSAIKQAEDLKSHKPDVEKVALAMKEAANSMEVFITDYEAAGYAAAAIKAMEE